MLPKPIKVLCPACIGGPTWKRCTNEVCYTNRIKDKSRRILINVGKDLI